MIAGHLAIIGVLALSGAALIKYLFGSGHGQATA